MAGKFELYKDSVRKFRFRLEASNGQVVATGEAYETRASAMKGIEAVCRTPATWSWMTRAAKDAAGLGWLEKSGPSSVGGR